MKKNLQKIDFKGKTIFVGLDVHMKSWHATIINGEVITRQSFSSNPEELHSYLSKRYPGASIKVAYEAGYTGFSAYRALSKLGMEVMVVNPADIPTTDKDNRNKTDKRDSKKIALSLKAGMLNKIYVPPLEAEEDRALVRCRASLKKDETRTKLRIKAFMANFRISIPERFEINSTHWSKNFIKWLESIEFQNKSMQQILQCYLAQLKFLRQEILKLTRAMRELSRKETNRKSYNIIISTPGIGMLTAMTLLTEIHDINRFKSLDKLLSYVGLIPTEHSSGERQRKGKMTQRKNASLRHKIIESAWVAIRYDPALAQYYSETKLKIGSKKAIVKTAKKLISKLYRIWTHGEMYVKGVA